MKASPFEQRDFRRGVIRKSSVANSLMPENSVSFSQNMNFDEIIGSAKVRAGTTKIGATVAANKTPLGLTEFIDSGGTNKRLISVFSGASTASIYYYDSSWHTSTVTNLSNTTKNRFATLGNRVYRTNPVDGIASSADGNTWDTTNLTTAGIPLVTIADTPTGSSNQPVGNAAGTTKVAQSFTTGITGRQLYNIVFRARKFGTPVDNLVIALQADTAGAPSGVNLVSKTIGGGSLTTSFTTQTVLGDSTTMNASSTYWIVWSRSGANDVTDFYDLQIDSVNNPFSGGNMATYNGAVWTNVSASDVVLVINVLVKPSLILRTKARLIVAGDPSYRDRIFFSQVIDPNANPNITWNTSTTLRSPSTTTFIPVVVVPGDWIDVNPDDNGNITALVETSNLVLVFKDNGMYRLNVINKDVDAQNIFNIGAVSQEAVTTCQGIVYFYSGQDIRRTNGDYPEQVSRLGVQDVVNAIPQSGWVNVASGTDGFNVYFSIGNVTLFVNQNEQVTLTNVVLKFSARDDNWSIHSYAQAYRFYSPFTTSDGVILTGAETAGNVQQINSGTTDNTSPIFYQLDTQELEFGSRATMKKIADKLIVYMRDGIDTAMEIIQDYGNPVPVNIVMDKDINIGRDLNFEGRFFTLRFSGESTGTPPIIQGYLIPDITDTGIN